MNKFLALQMGVNVERAVLSQCGENQIDLNSVNHVTIDCLQVGETKTGLFVLIRTTPKGYLIETFVKDVLTHSESIKFNIPQRYRFENPTLNDAIKNGFKVRQGDELKSGNIGSPSQLAHVLNYALVKLPWGFGLTTALYNDKGELVTIGDYTDTLNALKGA